MSSGSFKADFSLKVGSKKRAATYFIFGAIVILGIPLLLILFNQDISAAIASLVPMFNPEDLAPAMDLVKGVSVTYLLFGLPILLLRIPIGFYPDGSWSRLTFSLISGVYAVFWVYMIVGGGVIGMDGIDLSYDFGGGTVTSMVVVMDITGFLFIILGLAALKNIVPVAEFIGARGEYLHGPKKGGKKKGDVDRTTRVKGRHSGD